MDIEWDESQRQAPPAAPVRKHVKPGRHALEVASVEEMRSKKGHQMLKVVLRVQGGMDNGLHIYEYVNIGHPNIEVKARAKQRLQGLARGVGITSKFNTSELVGKSCRAEIVLEDGGEYGPTARVQFYLLPGYDPNAPETNDDMEAADLPF